MEVAGNENFIPNEDLELIDHGDSIDNLDCDFDSLSLEDDDEDEKDIITKSIESDLERMVPPVLQNQENKIQFYGVQAQNLPSMNFDQKNLSVPIWPKEISDTSQKSMLPGIISQNLPFSKIYQFNNMNMNFPLSRMERQEPREHIKKPLNAFMLYMRDIRPEVLKEVPHKDSTTINQMIGKKWQALSKEEQAVYFEKAKEEREKHRQMYPEYNPRDHYTHHLRKKRRKRDKNGNDPLPKKCRARFGLDQQDKWCKHCKRKKKCLLFMEQKNESNQNLPQIKQDKYENLSNSQKFDMIFNT